MTDKFISFWDAVIFYFWDNPFVVGIDPLNEPWPGNLVLYPDLQTPGYADANSLQPVYAKIFARLMQHYSTHDGRLLNAQMWFEPVTNPNVNGFEGKIYNVGFTEPPGYAQSGLTKVENYVLNDHTYCCQLVKDPEVCAAGEPNVIYKDDCKAWHEQKIQKRVDDAKTLGVPLHITEFGACLTEESCTQEITQVADTCDSHMIGWAYWQFKYYEDLTTTAGTGSEGFYNPDGTLQTWKVKALSRSYVRFT